MNPTDRPSMTVAAGHPKPQRMLYEKCSMCNNTGKLADDKPCYCEALHVVNTGLTVSQAERLAELDIIRQQLGISAANLRDWLKEGKHSIGALIHGYSLIEADMKDIGWTDASTPLFQRVRNLIAFCKEHCK